MMTIHRTVNLYCSRYLGMARLFFVFFICLFFIGIAECAAPVSNAGLDRVVEPGGVVELDGAGSSTSSGVWYKWEQLSVDDGGGPAVKLDRAETLNPRFMPIESENGEVYLFTLVVAIFENGVIKFDTDIVKISVRSPRTFNVPSEEYPTIESALKDARNIDTVILESGEYSESNLIVENGVRVLGAGSAETVITGTGNKPVFIIAKDNGTISEISSLTIKDGLAVNGAAILCDENSRVRINDVIFIGNKAVDDVQIGAGGGVYVSNGAKAIIKHCRFIGNFAKFDSGSAIFVALAGESIISNNWFIDNDGTPIAIDGVRENVVDINNNIFWGNGGSSSLSDAVYLDNWAEAKIVNNTFFENGTLLDNDKYGSGTIRIVNSSKAKIENNIFSNNRNKITIFFDTSSDVRIFYNDFWMNGKGASEFVESVEYLKTLEENEEIASSNMFLNPVFVGPYPYKDFSLASFPLSPCRDAGMDEDDYNDIDGSRNDMGFSGGAFFYMPTPEKKALDALRRLYSEFGAHVQGNNLGDLSKLFVLPDTNDEEMVIFDLLLSSSEWKKTKPLFETLFDSSHLLVYSANPTNIVMSADGETLWVSENAEIRQFRKDSFSYAESIVWLKRERFTLSSEGKWLRVGDGSAVIPKWSLHITRTAKDDFDNYKLKADFTPRDISGNAVLVEEVVLILPNGQEKVFSEDEDGSFHVIENTFSPVDGLYTLRVVDEDENEILASLRTSSTGVLPIFPEIPSVRFSPASGIEWEMVDGAKSYTVEITRVGEDAVTFYVEDSTSFGDKISFFPILPDGSTFVLKSDDWVRVIARNSTSDELQIASASTALLIKSPGVNPISSSELHVVDGDGNPVHAARINFLNGGLVEDSQTGDFSYKLEKGKEYIVRFSAESYYPGVFIVTPDVDNFSKTVVLDRLPKNITSVIVPTMCDAMRVMLLFMILACFYLRANTLKTS